MTGPRRAIVWLAALAVVLGASIAGASAQGEPAPASELEILLGGAFPDGKLVGESEENHFNLLLGLRFGHLLTERTGFFADATFIPFDGSEAVGDATEFGIQVGPEFVLNPSSSWRWFVAPSVGRAWYSPDLSANFERWRYGVGVGQRHSPSDRGRFRWELRALRTNGDDGLDGEDITNFYALVGFGWGTGGTPADADGDGVGDRKDKCPDTPRGATVDVNGCPTDADGDGVWDGLDTCPDTPSGTKVDEKGCPMDSDGDGVHDGPDQCPDTPRGAKVDARGCPTDADGDGVWDGLDRCPDTARGTKVDASGCPLDSDGDGVTDDRDRCPGTPRGTTVDADGCPPPAPPPPQAPLPERGQALVLEGVNFETNSATLTAESISILDRVAESLVANPEVKVEVGGHTDSRGSAAYNQGLSGRRAESVRTHLVSKGVEASRLTAKGYGEAQPVDSNDTEEGRLRNRRVELKRVD